MEETEKIIRKEIEILKDMIERNEAKEKIKIQRDKLDEM